jgi:hypothetical protein
MSHQQETPQGGQRLSARDALLAIAERAQASEQADCPAPASTAPKRWTEEALTDLRWLRARGRTARQIGELLGYSQAAVAAACRRYGIPSSLSPAGFGRGEMALNRAEAVARGQNNLASMGEDELAAAAELADDLETERRALREARHA